LKLKVGDVVYIKGDPEYAVGNIAETFDTYWHYDHPSYMVNWTTYPHSFPGPWSEDRLVKV
jgi:hypothetical protein